MGGRTHVLMAAELPPPAPTPRTLRLHLRGLRQHRRIDYNGMRVMELLLANLLQQSACSLDDVLARSARRKDLSAGVSQERWLATERFSALGSNVERSDFNDGVHRPPSVPHVKAPEFPNHDGRPLRSSH